MYDKYLPKDCVCGQTSKEDGTCDGSHSNVCEEPSDLNEDVPFGD